MDRGAVRVVMALAVAMTGPVAMTPVAAASLRPSTRWKAPAAYTPSPAFYGINGLNLLEAALAAERRGRAAAAKAQDNGWSSVRPLANIGDGDGRSFARHFDLGGEAAALSLDVVRGKYRSDPGGDPWGEARAHGGSWSAILGQSLIEDGDDAIRLSAGLSLQHARFSTAVDDGHRDKAMAGTIGMNWVRDGMMALNAGWYRARSASSRRDPLARSILLAAGATVAEQGPMIAFALAPGGLANERALQFGVQASDYAVSARDAIALGGVSGTDRRLMFTVSKGF